MVPAAAHSAGRIVLDQYRPAPWLLHDPGFLGMSRLAGLLDEEGYRPVRSLRPLTASLPELDTADVLLLSVSKYGRYDSAEIEAVRRFVEGGGKLLVFGEHDDVYRVSSGLQNPMLAAFGMEFAADTVQVAGEEWIDLAVPEMGIRRARLYAAVSLRVRPPAWLLPASSPVLAGWKNEAGGRVLAVGDSEFPLNGNEKFGIDDGENRKFFLALLRWLLGPRPPVPFSTPAAELPAVSPAHVLYAFCGPATGRLDREMDGYSLLADELRTRGFVLRRLVDLRKLPPGADLLLLRPLGPLPEDLSFRRALICVDSWSRIDDYTDNGILLREMGIVDGRDPPPFVRLLARHGVECRPGTLFRLTGFLEEERSFFVGVADGRFVKFKRPAWILAPDAELLLVADVHATPVSLGLDERLPWHPAMETRFYDPRDDRPENVGRTRWHQLAGRNTRPRSDVPPGPHPLLLRSGKLLVLADADAISNQLLQDHPDNRWLLERIADFLQDRPSVTPK